VKHERGIGDRAAKPCKRRAKHGDLIRHYLRGNEAISRLDFSLALGKRADTPQISGKQSGEALTVFDGGEDEMSHGVAGAVRGERQREHGEHPKKDGDSP
jgi:hypothetical protein